MRMRENVSYSHRNPHLSPNTTTMESLGPKKVGEDINTEVESFHQLPVEEDPSQFLEKTSDIPQADYCHGQSLNPDEQIPIIGATNMQQVIDKLESIQLAELQDSCLSPALTLIPQGKMLIPSESTLLHQTDLDFVPLRGSLDLSVVSEQCPNMSQLNKGVEFIHPDGSHLQISLSQHPLEVTSAFSEDESNCGSLSQHSLSPSTCGVLNQDEKHGTGVDYRYKRELEGEEQFGVDMYGKVASLSGVPVCSFPRHENTDSCKLTYDVSVPPNRSPNGHTEIQSEQKFDSTTTDNLEPRASQSREQPQGGSSFSVSQRKTMGSVSVSSHLSALSNITVRSKNIQSDETIDFPYRQLQLSNENVLLAAEGRRKTESKDTPTGQFISPAVAAVIRNAHWSSGRHMAVDESFLTSQPMSQSTPAVPFGKEAQVQTRLSHISSFQDSVAISTLNSSPNLEQIPVLDLNAANLQSIPEVVTLSAPVKNKRVSPVHPEMPLNQVTFSPRQDVVPSFSGVNTAPDKAPFNAVQSISDCNLNSKHTVLSAGRVHSLPCLSYLEKVDVWKVNQSSSRSFYDDLALHEIDDIPPKIKALDSKALSTNTHSQYAQEASDMRDKLELKVAEQPALASLQSYSHSAPGTIIAVQQHYPGSFVNSDSISPGVSSVNAERLQLSSESNKQRSADPTVTGYVTAAYLSNLKQKMNTVPNPNMPSTLSNANAEQGLQESFIASSVVSLEVDNYAPYWTSRPSSPPHSSELNIEDRIPVYLHNLGIDQSPSKILNPFTQRGPFREPEFSPTDFCTIKGSVGTPTKSTQLSEGDCPQKDTFSTSSMISTDSSASLTQSITVYKLGRPPSPGNVRMARHQPETPSQPHFSQHINSLPQDSYTPQQSGSFDLSTQISLESVPITEQCLEVKEGESSLLGAANLHEIRCLLGHAGSLVTGQSPLTSSAGSHSYSDSDASMLSLRHKTQSCHDDSSLSLGGKVSLVLARSSSDSALKESSSSSCGAVSLSKLADHMVKASSVRESNLKSRDLHDAPRRTEPEGCSAADPDRAGPASLAVKQRNSKIKLDNQMQSQDGVKAAKVSSSITSSTHSTAEEESGVQSDSSSEGSLTARVAKILQSESSVSMVTSLASTTDSEQAKAKDLAIDIEDRKRIEEIKRELLLHTKLSSDSDHSTQSSSGPLPHMTVSFPDVHSAENSLTNQPRKASQISFDSIILKPMSPHQSLEDKVRQIAIKEGIRLSQPLTSTNITTTQRTPSPQFQTLHLHDLDIQKGTKMLTCLRSPDEFKPQTKTSNKATGKNDIGTLEEDKKKNNDQKDLESKRMASLSIKELSLKDNSCKREVNPHLESPSYLTHNSQLDHISLSLSAASQQNIIETPQSSPAISCSKFDLQTEAQTHHSEATSGMTSKELSPLVSSTKEEKHLTSSVQDKDAEHSQNSKVITGFSQKDSRYQYAFIPPQRLPGHFSVHSAVPTLLPYKPHGSSELFYMPQTDEGHATSCSETTIESSHPGSDDAVPPRFTTEVLGSREIEDSKVTPKHKEGIYSKRAKMNRGVHAGTFSQSTGSANRLLTDCTITRHKDQGAMNFSEKDKGEEAGIPLNVEADYSTEDLHNHKHSVRQNILAPETPIPIILAREDKQDLKAKNLNGEIGESLDQMWQRFNESWSLQNTQPSSEREVSLLERLERLSRLLHSSSAPQVSAKLPCRPEEDKSGSIDPNLSSIRQAVAERQAKNQSEVGINSKIAWASEPSVRHNHTSEKQEQEVNLSCPAEKDDSSSVSVKTRSSQSTVNTQRLLKAFKMNKDGNTVRQVVTDGHQRSDSLLQLYTTINKQKTERQQRKARPKHHHVSISTDTSSTEESLASFNLESSSIYSLSPQNAKSKRPKVKLVSRGIQAGDLEIVVNGTRKHTRDVGTTFPSPCNTMGIAKSAINGELPAMSSTLVSVRSAYTQYDPTHTKQTVKNKQKPHPDGLSWFVTVEELKRDAPKENEPHELLSGHSWFEPHSRVQAWREPLRERHIQVEQKKSPLHKSPLENHSSHKPSSLVCLSLQEALQLHRPEFVSRSRERLKRLCLLAEERKLQTVFNKERYELFHQPSRVRLPAAGPPVQASVKRVIPISEMVQRSKRIYDQLPEVQKRKEEEKRKAEYRTYRLNAQLFNKFGRDLQERLFGSYMNEAEGEDLDLLLYTVTYRLESPTIFWGEDCPGSNCQKE